MKTRLFMLLAGASLLITPLVQAEENASSNSWQEWVTQATNKVTDTEIKALRAKLSATEQKSFDTAGMGTQSLAVVIQKGLMAQDPAMKNSYALSYKLANKAEVGYYMDQIKKRLTY
ncbi:MAG: hypothetical protein S4CHLAM123_10640 [Chlamydiales bacterium]|nr:hypothetical protein [Chlamydiales bacterium]